MKRQSPSERYKIHRNVLVNGKKRSIYAQTEQEYADKIIFLSRRSDPEASEWPFGGGPAGSGVAENNSGPAGEKSESLHRLDLLSNLPAEMNTADFLKLIS